MSNTIKEFDGVRILHPIEFIDELDEGKRLIHLPVGTRGVAVDQYPGTYAFEVEFTLGDPEDYDYVMVSIDGKDLELA